MNVESLIEKIELEPETFVEKPSLKAIYHFIRGYLYNKFDANQADDIDEAFYDYFHGWVQNYLKKNHSMKCDQERNYLFYISCTFPDSEEQRMRVFFDLSKKFFGEMSKGK